MNAVLKYVGMRFDLYALVLMTGIGLFLVFVDGENLRRKKLKKDASIAQKMGYFYIVFAVAMYIIRSLGLR
ncbi:CLC_0170 family protein [Caldanaerobius polysaccharolyticus]|uniref:CLC_0170 family protein n=1 Tax=Caldanaerobius polysaccharolyticus TaxID=44256 RepID=UPI00047B8B01|nr:CLC_0170 family protein [Caldanaerobius polysaccharolyticus]